MVEVAPPGRTLRASGTACRARDLQQLQDRQTPRLNLTALGGKRSTGCSAQHPLHSMARSGLWGSPGAAKTKRSADIPRLRL